MRQVPTLKIYREVVTPESAQDGEITHSEEIATINFIDDQDLIDEVTKEIERYGNVEPSCSDFTVGIWYTTIDQQQNPHDGSYENYTFHLTGFDRGQQQMIWELLTQ